MDEQQEFWHVIKGTPRNIRSTIHMLQWLNKQLEKPKVLKANAEKATLAQQDAAEKARPGEHSMDFMARDGKYLAEPQILDESIDLEKLKTLLTEDYKLQFHFKPLENGQMEFHFFGKDANVAAQALKKAVLDIVKHPEKVAGKSKDLDTEIKEAKTQQGIMREHQAAQKADKAAEKESERLNKTADIAGTKVSIKAGEELTL